jgi:hypothetical protein
MRAFVRNEAMPRSLRIDGKKFPRSDASAPRLTVKARREKPDDERLRVEVFGRLSERQARWIHASRQAVPREVSRASALGNRSRTLGSHKTRTEPGTRNPNDFPTTMIKPTFLLVLLALSLLPTVVVGKAEDEAALPLPSAPALRSSAGASALAAEAARAPAAPQMGQNRDLQGAMLCFKAGEDGKATPAPCGSVGHCDSYACCKSMSACFGLGQYMCGGDSASGFAIQHVIEATCPYKWSCCYTE